MSTCDTPAGDTRAGGNELTDRELLRRISELRRTDNVAGWYYLAREYLYLAAAVGSTIVFFHLSADWELAWLWAVPAALLCIVAVGAGQHRLATLTHEAAHYMLFRNRLLNELVSEWFCMYPMLATTHPYRVQHIGHHQHANDPDRDPDWTQLRASGHRFQFPMSRGRFLWQCVFKQLLWPAGPIHYVLVRALQVVDQGPGSPYRLRRRTKPLLTWVAALYAVALIASLAWFAWRDDRLLLAVVPVLLWLTALAFYGLVPGYWFGEYFIRCDLPPRAQACLRLTYYALAWPAIAWLTVLTGRPWWLFYLVLWIVPLGTSFAFFMLLRQFVQHGNADRGRLTNTRIFEVHPLLGFAVFPLGNDYHLPHHLFPMVPHYNLRKAHALLMEAEAYRDDAVFVEGYFLHRTQPPEHPTVLDLVSADPFSREPPASADAGPRENGVHCPRSPEARG